jgi:glutathione S-transferase
MTDRPDRPLYKLYYMPTTASLSVHWVLVFLEQQANVRFTTQLVSFPRSDQRSPAFLHLNPKGRVPTLLIHPDTPQEHVLTESPAILQYLAERHPEARLAPPVTDEPSRAKYLETMTYLANTLLPALRDNFYADKDGEPGEPARAVKTLAQKRINQAWDYLDRQLNGHEWLVGNDRSAADFLLVSIMGWSEHLHNESCQRSNLRRLAEKMERQEDWLEMKRREQQAEAEV